MVSSPHFELLSPQCPTPHTPINHSGRIPPLQTRTSPFETKLITYHCFALIKAHPAVQSPAKHGCESGLVDASRPTTPTARLVEARVNFCKLFACNDIYFNLHGKTYSAKRLDFPHQALCCCYAGV